MTEGVEKKTLKALLMRMETGDEGTFGELSIEAPQVPQLAFTCRTIELPWRDNAEGKSCIPSGDYRVVTSYSKKFDRYLFEVLDVPGRSGVRIHEMNFAGDESKGFKAESDGCIGVGRVQSIWTPKGYSEPQHAVTRSEDTLVDLHTFCEEYDLDLAIAWADGINPEQGGLGVQHG
ncbi:hypothetical protein KQI63_15785 [bacterium]|nr:hypothetical protein [bacterium]